MHLFCFAFGLEYAAQKPNVNIFLLQGQAIKLCHYSFVSIIQEASKIMILPPTQPIEQTTLKVPLVGFGTGPLGFPPGWEDGEPIAEKQALQALQYAFDKGIRFFDSAPLYGKGLAETRTGKFLGQVPREQIIISTKVGVDIRQGDVRRDYSRDGVLRSLEGSLKRLQVDTVDILYVHDPDD